MIILFNVFDTIGRKISPLYLLPNNIIVSLALARMVFFVTTYKIAFNNITLKKD